MRADFHLLRQSALGVCGAALLGFSLGGCVSTHKPRFWDQQDVKNSPDAANSPTAATAANDPAAAAKPAPAVVAADHATTSDASGHVEAFDFADSTPSAPATQNAVASDSQPAAPPKPASSTNETLAPSNPPTAASDAFDDPKPAAPAPRKSAVMPGAKDPIAVSATPASAAPSSSLGTPTPDASGKDSSTAVIVSSSTGARNADPFGAADNPVFVGNGQAQPTAPPTPPQSTASQDAVPSSPPAAPQQSDLFETAPQASTPGAPKSSITVSEQGRAAADPFADSQLIAAPKAPVAPAPMAVDGPNCAAPGPTPNVPRASADILPATPAEKQASTPVAKAPSRAPASTEQAADFEPVVPIPQVSRDVVPTSKSSVAAKPETTSGNPKPAIKETPDLEAKEPEWTPASGMARPANVSDAMILDSGSVRGRFTGIEHPKAKTSRPPLAPRQEVPSQPTTQPSASRKAPAAPPAAGPAPPTESVPTLDTEGAFAPASPNVPAVGQTAHEPVHKPLSGVVNAVAQQVSPAAVADPFALEQTVETSAATPSKPREPHTLASVNAAQELDPFGEPSLLESHDVPSAEATAVASVRAHHWSSLGSEIAFVIGLAVGLSTGLLVWLRSRLRKVQVPNV